jgi:hypothetical protein
VKAPGRRVERMRWSAAARLWCPAGQDQAGALAVLEDWQQLLTTAWEPSGLLGFLRYLCKCC